MRPVESFIAQPVRSLQTMLRIILADRNEPVLLIPDGIYGAQTVAAVSAFQRRHGLPVTGITDQQTWESIVEAFGPAEIRTGAAQPVQIILNPGEVIRKGQHHTAIFLVQSMLTVLADVYKSISSPSFSGILDLPTSHALEEFQVLSGLPMTGELDKITWKHLALHYPLASNLRPESPAEQSGKFQVCQ